MDHISSGIIFGLKCNTMRTLHTCNLYLIYIYIYYIYIYIIIYIYIHNYIYIYNWIASGGEGSEGEVDICFLSHFKVISAAMLGDMLNPGAFQHGCVKLLKSCCRFCVFCRLWWATRCWSEADCGWWVCWITWFGWVLLRTVRQFFECFFFLNNI